MDLPSALQDSNALRLCVPNPISGTDVLTLACSALSPLSFPPRIMNLPFPQDLARSGLLGGEQEHAFTFSMTYQLNTFIT